MATVTYQEYAGGIARTYKGLTIMFPFGTPPRVLFGDIPTRIDEPERFGAWETSNEQYQYVLSYYEQCVVIGKDAD